MKKISLALLVILWGHFMVIARIETDKDPKALLIINDEPVYLDEFKYAFLKNTKISDSIDVKKEVYDYLELYINFKLKVKEARAAGIDTTESFQTEFRQYKGQLENPYLTINQVEQRTINKVYERYGYEISAAHILKSIEENAKSSDTLEAYNFLLELKNQINSLEDFKNLASKHSDDPSAKTNQGNLGYFSALQMVLPFEEAAYGLEIGEISDPVRSRFGYHLIYLIDKIKNRGKVKVAHIMLRDQSGETKGSQAEVQIEKIYDSLNNGGVWSDLCRVFSQDGYTKEKDGELPFFGHGEIDQEFEKIAFDLEDSEISKPFKTRYGWHIAKKIATQGVPAKGEVTDRIKSHLSRYKASSDQESRALLELKKSYDFEEMVSKEVDCVLDERGTLFTFDRKKFGSSDLNDFLIEEGLSLEEVSNCDSIYTEFQKKAILDYEREELIYRENEDLRFLAQEYEDGILLFDLMEDSVWNRASQDTVQLMSFYDRNSESYHKPLKEIRGSVISDFQDQLEKQLVARLRDKYKVKVNKKALNGFIKTL